MVKQESSVYLLAGTEHFLKEESLAKIKSAFLDSASADFNFNVFYAGTQDAEKILECANTVPFLGEKRVVLVRQVEDLSVADKRFILSYIQAPQKHTLLILETSQDYLNQGFLAEISQFAKVIFCRPVQGNRLLTWIRGFVQAQGKRIDEEALRLLVDNLGNSLQSLASALDNLILYIGEEDKIEADDVAMLVGPDVDAGAFELFDAVFARNKKKAFQILDSLLKDGVNSAQILGALAHKIISERLGQHLLDLQKTDWDIKTGRQNQRFALELLVAKLMQP